MATNYITQNYLSEIENNQDKKSYSFSFDGTGDYIDLGTPSELNLAGNMSFSAWINSTVIDTTVRCIAGQSNTGGTNFQWFMDINRYSGKLTIGTKSNEILTSTTTLSADTWYYVAFTRTGSTGSWDWVIYLNGVADGSVTGSAINPAAQEITSIGRFGELTGNNFSGNIAEVAVFDYALTSGNITSLYGDATDGTGNPMDLTTKPVGYWSADSSTFGSVFNVQNKATELYSNYSFNFDGANDYITLDSELSYSGDFSVSMWLYITDDTGGRVFLGNSTGADGFLYIKAGIGHVLYIGSGDIATQFNNTAFTVDEWAHLVVTRDSSDVFRAYKNGALTDTSVADAGTFAFNQLGLYGTTDYEFAGNMCEVAVWNTALTSGNVTTIYNSGKPDDLTSLSPVAWWRLGQQSFWDGTNWVVRDQIGSNDATSSNMATDDLEGDAPNTSGSGTSSGLAVEDRKGDLKYSEANAVSFNMAYATRVTSVP